MTIKILAKISTSEKLYTVYCSLKDYLWSYKVYTNCKAFLNGEQYYIYPRQCKVLGKA